MNTLILVTAALIGIGYLFYLVSILCFDDDDPDMDWMDNYAPTTCPHLHKTEVVVESSATCETIHIICDACSLITNTRTDC